MQFVYFIGQQAADAATLERLGLAAVLVGPHAQGNIDKGPGGMPGVLVAAGEGPSPAMRYAPADQRWIPIRVAGATETDDPLYWLGMDLASPPQPAELARDRQIDGKCLVLGDGNTWLVPKARFCDGGVGLTRRLVMDETGAEVLEVVAEQRQLFAMACEVWDDFVVQVRGQDCERMTLGRAAQIAIAALATNYRLGRAEAAALGLLRTDCIPQILRVLADVDGFEELAAAEESKKNGSPHER